MAQRVYGINVTVPAGTPPSIPFAIPWVTEDEIIVSVEILIPAGHNGFTGVRLRKGDVQILPFSPNTWIVANDYTRVFELNEYIPTGDMFVEAYNQGGYNHTFYLRMTLSDANKAGGTPIATESSAISGLSEETLGSNTNFGAPVGAGNVNQIGPESATISQQIQSNNGLDATGIENVSTTVTTPGT